MVRMEKMTMEEARGIRRLRVEQCYTWRAIATECNYWYEDTTGVQCDGERMCIQAAEILDEGWG